MGRATDCRLNTLTIQISRDNRSCAGSNLACTLREHQMNRLLWPPWERENTPSAGPEYWLLRPQESMDFWLAREHGIETEKHGSLSTTRNWFLPLGHRSARRLRPLPALVALNHPWKQARCLRHGGEIRK